MSRHVRALARRVGVALFMRRPQRVALTEAAERLARTTASACHGLADALRAFSLRER